MNQPVPIPPKQAERTHFGAVCDLQDYPAIQATDYTYTGQRELAVEQA